MGLRILIVALCLSIIFAVVVHGVPVPSNNPFSPSEYDEEVLIPVQVVYEEPSFTVPVPPGQGRDDGEDDVEDDEDDDEDSAEETEAADDEDDKDKVKAADDDDDDDDDTSDENELDDDDEDDDQSDEDDVDPETAGDDPGPGHDVPPTPRPVPVHVPLLLDDGDVAALTADPKGHPEGGPAPVNAGGVPIFPPSNNPLSHEEPAPGSVPVPELNARTSEGEEDRKERLLYFHPNTKYGWHGTWSPLFGSGGDHGHQQYEYSHNQQHQGSHGKKDVTYHHGFYTSLY